MLGGIGASVQLPIASSIVARAVLSVRSRTALGIDNFTGDIVRWSFPRSRPFSPPLWRGVRRFIAGSGILAAVLLLRLAARCCEDGAASGPAHDISKPSDLNGPSSSIGRGFRLLFSISLIDSAARMGFLTFLPFLLEPKGATIAELDRARPLVFAGGAA